MTDYFIAQNKITLRQHNELAVMDYNFNIHHKYQTEYKVHCWIPPITEIPPRDSSIEDLII
tara:strand:+ start:912 stop:1094 length:183 start_codon:yes stop_codon:yes gene_type:complete